MTLLEVAELFAKSIEREIRRSLKDGDDEGANLKRFTLHMVKEAIAKAKDTTLVQRGAA